MGVITKPICDPDKDWKRPKEVIPNNKTKGAEAAKPQCWPRTGLVSPGMVTHTPATQL